VAGSDKQADIADLVKRLAGLSPAQVEVILAIIERFGAERIGEQLRADFLSTEAFEYFSMRLAAHHAYSSHQLKKENFEHILEKSFNRAGVVTSRPQSMTERGADLTVGGVKLSLKTEAARSISTKHITISKLMEARWIRDLKSTRDIPAMIASKIMTHFSNYDRIFVLRSYADSERAGSIRYDLREIPKAILSLVGGLQAQDFSALTDSHSSAAEVKELGTRVFSLRLDGSVEKVTISNLKIEKCPLHAWWSMAPPA
jgi:hypothetical protein